MPQDPPPPPPPLSQREEQALADRNLRDFSWAALEGVRLALGYERGGAIIASLIGRLTALGEDRTDLKEASEIAVVHGLMVHGLPPRDEREWEIAARLWEPETLELMRTWTPLEGFLARGLGAR